MEYSADGNTKRFVNERKREQWQHTHQNYSYAEGTDDPTNKSMAILPKE